MVTISGGGAAYCIPCFELSISYSVLKVIGPFSVLRVIRPQIFRIQREHVFLTARLNKMSRSGLALFLLIL